MWWGCRSMLSCPASCANGTRGDRVQAFWGGWELSAMSTSCAVMCRCHNVTSAHHGATPRHSSDVQFKFDEQFQLGEDSATTL